MEYYSNIMQRQIGSPGFQKREGKKKKQKKKKKKE
jgi:hypothetical protein